MKLGKQYGLDELNIREQYPRLAEIPFDSARKLMSTVNQMDKQSIMITKGGALDVLLPKVTRIKTSTGIFEITPAASPENRGGEP